MKSIKKKVEFTVPDMLKNDKVYIKHRKLFYARTLGEMIAEEIGFEEVDEGGVLKFILKVKVH